MNYCQYTLVHRFQKRIWRNGVFQGLQDKTLCQRFVSVSTKSIYQSYLNEGNVDSSSQRPLKCPPTLILELCLGLTYGKLCQRFSLKLFAESGRSPASSAVLASQASGVPRVFHRSFLLCRLPKSPKPLGPLLCVEVARSMDARRLPIEELHQRPWK